MIITVVTNILIYSNLEKCLPIWNQDMANSSVVRHFEF